MSLITRLFLFGAMFCAIYGVVSATFPIIAIFAMFFAPFLYLLNFALFPCITMFLLSYAFDLIRENGWRSAGVIPLGIAALLITITLIPTLVARHRIDAYISAGIAVPQLQTNTTLDTPLVLTVNENEKCEDDCRSALYAGIVGKWVVPLANGTYKQYALTNGSSCDNLPWLGVGQYPHGGMNLYQLLGECITETSLTSAPDGIWVEQITAPENLPPYKYRGLTTTITDRKGGHVTILARNEAGWFNYPSFPPTFVTYLNSAHASTPTVRANSLRAFGNQKDWPTLVAETTNFAFTESDPRKTGELGGGNVLISDKYRNADFDALLEKIRNYSIISTGRSMNERAAFFYELRMFFLWHPEIFDKILPTVLAGAQEEGPVKSAALDILASSKTPDRQQYIPLFIELTADKEQFDNAISNLLEVDAELDEATLLQIVREMPERSEGDSDFNLVKLLGQQGSKALPALQILLNSQNSETVRYTQHWISQIESRVCSPCP